MQQNTSQKNYQKWNLIWKKNIYPYRFIFKHNYPNRKNEKFSFLHVKPGPIIESENFLFVPPQEYLLQHAARQSRWLRSPGRRCSYQSRWGQQTKEENLSVISTVNWNIHIYFSGRAFLALIILESRHCNNSINKNILV